MAERLFEAITHQLCARHITVKQGTLIDATIIASASKGDDEARWVKHKNKKAVHGYKAHVACDEDTALIERISVTPANVNDGKAGCAIVPDDPGEVYADSAYRGPRFQAAVEAKGGRARVVVSGVWARDEAEAQTRLKAINGPIHEVRGRIEKIFGTCKRHYGLGQMACIGLAKAGLQVLLHRHRLQPQTRPRSATGITHTQPEEPQRQSDPLKHRHSDPQRQCACPMAREKKGKTTKYVTRAQVS